MLRTVGALALLCSCGRTGPWPSYDLAVPSQVDLSATTTDLAMTDAAFHVCVPGALTITVAEPTVMFVLDRSGSMNDAFGSSTRWRSLTTGLAAALPPADSTMATGALLFPAVTANDGNGGMGNAASCTVPTSASLFPATGNVAALVSLMESTQPGGETPTASALQEAASILGGIHTATTARAMVLATDGAPNCNATLDAQTCTCANAGGGGGQGGGNRNGCGSATQCLDDTRTVSSIAAFAKLGVPTYVVGIATGDTVYTSTLNAMAIAGGRPNTSGGTSYYPATSDAQLEAALAQIRAQVGACEYLVTDAPTDGTVTVSIAGTTIPYDPTGVNGWTWVDKANGQLAINGVDCTTLAGMSAPQITADAGCPVDGGG